MNAFFTLNKGIENSNKIVDNTNETINKNIVKQAEANKKDVNIKYKDNAQKDVVAELVEFNTYVDGIKKTIFDAAGGPSKDDPTRPINIKDKDIPTRLLVYDNSKRKDGIGVELEKKINEFQLPSF